MTAKKPAAPQSSPLALPLSRHQIAVDDPEEGESGTIYEYRIKDAHGDLIAVTYDSDWAGIAVRRVNQGPAFDAMVVALGKAEALISDQIDKVGFKTNSVNHFGTTLDVIRAALKLAEEVR